ncbi:Thiol-disulfide isomerase or thioredoxin [Mucilaginibacter lappiensis]|uniref:Thiol-disulfide isomerase/thioredoxin n=1 Tax=Mucilaginibacter lappiensis TaxID=354630 RepID=A0ABR6PDJ7_9SPHI|nr:TlpA disulfide reductase family protein [Mucilaginibacter lappiensis]MBB6107814.1 thiol-disulfide isomerase/thioredoxin [Mucilaginibacter lappiensis]SIP96305.1 Thiol-disulfide isomerase or thioredoxin [Mucilaginibacter lappiensis]
MRNNLLAVLFLLLTNFASNSNAQTKPLAIGDKVPDIIIKDVLNYKTTSTKLSDFKGKLLILDFWATWCSPCVAMLPKTDSLQKKFAGEVEILPVTYEDKTMAAAFLTRLKSVKHISISSVINDKILNSLFVHGSIPYYVWIDKNGTVIATTESKEINEKNIRLAIDGVTPGIKNTIGELKREVDFNKTIFVTGIPFKTEEDDSSTHVEPILDNQILYQSILDGYVPNVVSKMYFDSSHFVATNAPILNFYRLYWGLKYNKSPLLFWGKSRYAVEIKDSVLYNKITSPLHGSPFDAWLVTNGYTYELIWKSARKWKDKYALLAEDLDRYFGKPFKLSVGLEKRMLSSDVLIETVQNGSLKTTGGTPFEKHNAYSYTQHNMPLSHFIALLEGYFWQNSERAVFDETKMNGNVDLILNCSMLDVNAVNKELEKYKLKFIAADRMTDVLVFKEDKTINSTQVK